MGKYKLVMNECTGLNIDIYIIIHYLVYYSMLNNFRLINTIIYLVIPLFQMYMNIEYTHYINHEVY